MPQASTSVEYAHRQSVSATRPSLTGNNKAEHLLEQSKVERYVCAVRSSVVRSSRVDGRKSSALIVQSFRGECAGRVALFDVAGLHTDLASNQAPQCRRRLRGRSRNQHKRVSMLQLQLAPACAASAAGANNLTSLTTRGSPSTSISQPLTRRPLRHAGIAECYNSGLLR